jgi:hypothetical protein
LNRETLEDLAGGKPWTMNTVLAATKSVGFGSGLGLANGRASYAHGSAA